MSRKIENPFPPQVKRIGIPAPASMPKAHEIDAARNLLKSWGIEPVVGPNLLSGGDAAYLSASDETRLADLNAMINDESLDLILCARGGYGSMRILERVDWAALKRRNLPLLGYSDITAIHLGMLAKGAGVPVVCNMANNLKKAASHPYCGPAMARALKAALCGSKGSFEKMAMPEGRRLETLKAGSASGPLVPVNLTLLAALCGTQFMPSLKGAILLIEDVGEKPRCLDRMLAQLELSGILGQVSALLLGDFTDCGREPELRETFSRYLESVKGPVLQGVPFGHSLPSQAFAMGEKALVENASFYLES